MLISYLVFMSFIFILLIISFLIILAAFYYDKIKSKKKYDEKKIQRFLKKYNNYVSISSKQDGLKT